MAKLGSFASYCRRSGFPARPKQRQPARDVPSSHWRSWEASPPTVGGRASQPDQSNDSQQETFRRRIGEAGKLRLLL
ncbi:MAG: hypothetical protein IJR26_09890 [Bacteroidales bacterium]|nr:hypothetical protein [Bacteroidales bacterium]